jgi:hypothetical protein
VGLTGSYDRQVLSLGVQQLRDELEPPQAPLPALAYARDRVQPSPYLGRMSGTEFVDAAPENGILVGLIVSQGTNWGGAISAVQPIYQLESRYELGRRHGSAGGTEVRMLAKPGYAVAGLRVRSGLVLNALQLVFMRLEGKQLNPRDAYESSWVGADGGRPTEFFAQGRALAGVFGRYQDGLHGLGVGVIPQLRVRSSSAVPGPRTWRSADGQYSVEATLVEVADDQVVLRREDGKTVKVPVSRLSDADREYLGSR